MDLTESNVQTMFNKCLADNEEKESFYKSIELQILKPILTNRESEKIVLSNEKVTKNHKNIAFLLGQIKNMHKSTTAISLQEGFIKYDDTVWTRDYDTLFKLYSLAQANDYLFDFSSFKKNPNLIAATKTTDCTPTLSPKDPNFESWWAEHKSEWKDATPTKPAGQEPTDD